MIRLFIAFICAAAACMLVGGALSSAQSPTSATPDTFVTQVTNSSRDSFAGDLSANGRFLVIESTGDISTEKIPTFNSDGTVNLNARNNEDGNREIFLYDYAQRRIFQLTNTKSVLNPPGSPSPTPSPSPSPSPSVSPSPTPFPSPTPVGLQNVAIEISNNRPMISLEGTIPVAGQRTYTIVFSSNAPVSPASFDGTDPGAPTNTDMNQEIWTYKFTVPDVANLSSGAEVGPIDLTTGTFRRYTTTPASAPPVAGSTIGFPRTADDNRDASITDDGSLIAFVSTRDLAPPGNADTGAIPNPEIFLVNAATGAFTQITNTKTSSLNNPIFSANPCLSSDGSVLAFVSNANITGNNDDGGGLSNAEVYVRDGSGLRQVTKTKNDATTGVTANVFGFGRRLSRDGKFIAFESTATDPKANATPSASPIAFSVSFVYNVQADTFAQLGPRALAGVGDVAHFPTFTDYDGALSPKTVVFSSALNFLADGTFPTADQDATGLNFVRASQIFSAPLPFTATGPFTRLTNNVSSTVFFAGIRALPSSKKSRIAYSLAATELGGGNSDNSTEAFYQLLPDATESGATLTMSTGASRMTIPVASPTASPSPNASPSPSPSPAGSPTPGVAAGLATGELAFVQGFANPAPPPATVTVSAGNASESKRAPALPVELNGVSVAIRNAACGLYAVSPTEIKFVAPIGLGPGTYGIVINNNGIVSRGTITIVASQADIFTSTNGPLGRASVCNITNPAVCSPEPFGVTSNDGTGTQVATVLRVSLTGIRYNLASSITVTVGTTAIVASAARSLDLPGNDQVDFVLPSTVSTGDLPIVITVPGAGTTSRTTDTAPHITINPGASPAPNPITTSDFFVRQQYLDFLNREPDPNGFSFWTNQINSCGPDLQCIELKRINVSGAFFLSIEFQQTGYLVERMYKAAYGSFTGTSSLGGAHNIQAPIVRFSEFLPDTIQIGQGVVVGQGNWQQQLEDNKQAFAAAFVARTRFTSAFAAGMSATTFVDKLYTNAGLAPASGANRTAAINELATPSDPASRARALRLVAEDPMLVQQESNNAFVLMQYFGYLRRNPNDAPDGDYTGYDFWLTKLNQFNGNFVNAEMVKAFIVSSEYKQRFGQ